MKIPEKFEGVAVALALGIGAFAILGMIKLVASFT